MSTTTINSGFLNALQNDGQSLEQSSNKEQHDLGVAIEQYIADISTGAPSDVLQTDGDNIQADLVPAVADGSMSPQAGVVIAADVANLSLGLVAQMEFQQGSSSPAAGTIDDLFTQWCQQLSLTPNASNFNQLWNQFVTAFTGGGLLPSDAQSVFNTAYTSAAKSYGAGPAGTPPVSTPPSSPPPGPGALPPGGSPPPGPGALPPGPGALPPGGSPPPGPGALPPGPTPISSATIDKFARSALDDIGLPQVMQTGGFQSDTVPVVTASVNLFLDPATAQALAAGKFTVNNTGHPNLADWNNLVGFAAAAQKSGDTATYNALIQTLGGTQSPWGGALDKAVKQVNAPGGTVSAAGPATYPPLTYAQNDPHGPKGDGGKVAVDLSDAITGAKQWPGGFSDKNQRDAFFGNVCLTMYYYAKTDPAEYNSLLASMNQNNPALAQAISAFCGPQGQQRADFGDNRINPPGMGPDGTWQFVSKTDVRSGAKPLDQIQVNGKSFLAWAESWSKDNYNKNFSPITYEALPAPPAH